MKNEDNSLPNKPDTARSHFRSVLFVFYEPSKKAEIPYVFSAWLQFLVRCSHIIIFQKWPSDILFVGFYDILCVCVCGLLFSIQYDMRSWVVSLPIQQQIATFAYFCGLSIRFDQRVVPSSLVVYKQVNSDLVFSIHGDTPSPLDGLFHGTSSENGWFDSGELHWRIVVDVSTTVLLDVDGSVFRGSQPFWPEVSAATEVSTEADGLIGVGESSPNGWTVGWWLVGGWCYPVYWGW